MQLKIGDKVSFLNEKLDGVVSKIIHDKQVEVTTQDGFAIPVFNKELVKVFQETEEEPIIESKSIVNPIEKSISEIKPLKNIAIEEDLIYGREHIKKMFQEKIQTKVIGKISLKHSHRRKEVEGEIDLHIENLLDHWNNMSNGEIVVHQLKIARQSIDEAILQGKHRLVIIHGVGNGTLKSEVHKLIKSYYGLRIEEGHFLVYGAGATLVHL